MLSGLKGQSEPMPSVDSNKDRIQTDCRSARTNFRGVLIDKINRLRREADDLEELAKALPLELPYKADEAMWRLLTLK